MNHTLKQRITPYLKKGLSDTDIAKIFGVTRQRIYQVRTGYKSPSHRRAKRYRAVA